MSLSEKQREIMRFPYSGKSALICDGAVRSGKDRQSNIPAYRFGGALLLCLGGSASDVWETMELFMLEMQGNIQIQK